MLHLMFGFKRDCIFGRFKIARFSIMNLLIQIVVCSCAVLQINAPSSETKLDCGALVSFVALQVLRPDAQQFEEFVKDMGPMGDNGYDLKQISSILEKNGISTLAVHTTNYDELRSVIAAQEKNAPRLAVLRLDMNHFILLTDIDEVGIYYFDFPRAKQFIQKDDLLQRWKDGYALIVSSREIRLSGTTRRYWMLAATAFFIFVCLIWIIVGKMGLQRPFAGVAVFVFTLQAGCTPDKKHSENHDPIEEESKFLICEPPTVQLGEVEPDRRIDSEIQIKNIGFRSISIKSIVRSCSCLSIDIDDSNIEPGGSCKVKLSVLPEVASSNTSITIMLQNDRILIPVIWKCRTIIDFGTPELNFGYLQRGTDVERHLTIAVPNEFNPELLVFKCVPEGLVDADFDVEGKILTVRVKCKELGRWQGLLRVLDHENPDSRLIAELPIVWYSKE